MVSFFLNRRKTHCLVAGKSDGELFQGYDMNTSKLVFRCFMAGSTDLDEQRGYYYSAITALRNLWGNSYVLIEGKTYKDFTPAFTPHEDGNQGEYNQYIKEKADMIFFVIDQGVGAKTVQEYELAVSSFKEEGRPEIIVFCKKTADSDTADIRALKEKVADLKQYWVDYKDTYVLEYLFKDNINRFLIEKKDELGFLNSDVKTQLSIKCQEVVNALVMYLSTLDALCVEVLQLRNAWKKYCGEYRYALSAQGKELAVDDMLSAVKHYEEEVSRIAAGFDENHLKFTSETILVVGRYIQDAQELPLCIKNYLCLLNEAYQIAKSVVTTLKINKALNWGLLEAQLEGFQYMANADLYTIAGVIAQLPECYHENFYEFSKYWQTFPNGVSLNLKQEDYQRFAAKEFDHYQRLLDKQSGQIDIADTEMEQLKARLDSIANEQLSQAYHPSPIDLSSTVLPDHFKDLSERLVRETHDGWVDSELKQGWCWGEEYSEEKKTHPYLLPFEKLPEEIKSDYSMRVDVMLKRIYALGYDLIKR